MLFRTSRIRRNALLGALGVGMAALALPAQSLAGPVHTVSANPNGLSAASGNLVANLSDNSIRTTGPLAAGHRAGFRYCPPWINSTVKTLSTRSTRWHSAPHVGFLRALGASGEVGRITEARQAYLDPVRSDSWSLDSPCATLEFYASGARGHIGIWTAQIVGATVEDHQGPSVTSVGGPQGWTTASSAPISFSTGDNGLGQGAVTVSVGPVATDHGNLPTGARTVNAELGSLPDGQHTVTVTRAGYGWAPQSRSTQIRIDRNPPAAPAVSAGTKTWTNAPVTVAAPRTADGTGSGWKGNEYSINGGAWTAAENVRISAPGIHTITVRAVDNAGNASATSATTVRVDTQNPSGRLGGVRRVAAGAVITTVSAMDALSGVRSWHVVNAAGRTLASGSGSGREVVLTGSTGAQRLRLIVEDVAGNRAVVATRGVDFGAVAKQQRPRPPALPADLGPAPDPTKLGVPSRGLAGARVQKGTPLPFWVRSIRGVGARRVYALDAAKVELKLGGVSRQARIGKRRVPLVHVVGNKGKRRVTARFTTASGSRIPYPYAIVRNAGGDIVHARRGGRNGRFRFTVDKSRPGKWTVALWGRPELRTTILVRPAAQLRTSLRNMTISRNAAIKVAGRVTPASQSRGRVVQLQWLDDSSRKRTWRPIVNTRVNRKGRLLLRYRFRRSGGYTVKMRVAVLGSPGTPSLRTTPKSITVLP